MTTARPPDDEDPYLGRVIAGTFRVDARIGVGGVGTVYRATHLTLARPVALKILRASVASDANAVARFTRGARLASQLDHPNIMHVYDYGTEPDGLTYLAMELLDGPELAEVMSREAPMPSERIVALLSQVLSALAVAHHAGIVHRDLKPENILLVTRVGDDGEEHELVKVADFGIARAYGEETSQGDAITRFGAVSGTPEYMSPEQCRGEALDGRSDLYAVGVILYEAIAGRPPFVAESPLELLERRVRAPVVPPSRVRADVDPRLEAIALKALANDRDDRYADAAQMRDALRAAAELSGPLTVTAAERSGAAAIGFAPTELHAPDAVAAEAEPRTAQSRGDDSRGAATSAPTRVLGPARPAVRPGARRPGSRRAWFAGLGAAAVVAVAGVASVAWWVRERRAVTPRIERPAQVASPPVDAGAQPVVDAGSVTAPATPRARTTRRVRRHPERRPRGTRR